MPNTLVSIFLVLTPNHEGGERVWSIESDPQRAIDALKYCSGGRVLRLPDVQQWATYEGPTMTAYQQAEAEGKLGEFVAQNDL